MCERIYTGGLAGLIDWKIRAEMYLGFEFLLAKFRQMLLEQKISNFLEEFRADGMGRE